MAEVSDITIKRTQDSLGKLIKKPVLTDKLLRKPPFKFLHDIIHAVITNTGFLDGLYTDEELQSENIKDRDAKIAFLQKTIDALKIATKQDVRARPSKIVAGLEADKTNEFLIAIAKAIDRKIDSTDAVALVKSGKHNATQKKEPKATKAAEGESRKTTKVSKELTAAKKVKGSDTKALKKTSTNTKVAKQSSKESIDSKIVKARSNSQNKEKDKDKGKSKEREKKSTKAESIEQTADVAHINGNASDIEDQGSKPNIAKVESIGPIEGQDDSPKDKPMEQDEKVDQRQEESREEKSAKSTKSDKDEKRSDEKDQNQQDEIEMPKTQDNLMSDAPSAVISNSVQEKTSNDKSRSSKSRKSHSKHDIDKLSTNSGTKPELMNSKSVDQPLMDASKANDVTKPPKTRTALRSASVRPISARPSAPRRRDRNVRQILHTESFVQEPNNQNKPNKKNNIPEFDDADNIVITETIPDNITALDDTVTNTGDGEIDGKMHGHLVQQILDTQTSILKDVKNETSAVTDENILNDRKSITRNMTELRKMIQTLSLYITPLGKMMEYFQEDVDAMQIELLMWKKAGETAQTDIKEEQRSTDKLLENFKYQLAEINNSIKDHIDQINNTTTNIIQNEEKISKIFATL